MRVNKATLKREAVSKRFVLTTENRAFKKRYLTHIPVDITDEEWQDLLRFKTHTYLDAATTPILHKVKWQAIKYLKENNYLKQ